MARETHSRPPGSTEVSAGKASAPECSSSRRAQLRHAVTFAPNLSQGFSHRGAQELLKGRGRGKYSLDYLESPSKKEQGASTPGEQS